MLAFIELVSKSVLLLMPYEKIAEIPELDKLTVFV